MRKKRDISLAGKTRSIFAILLSTIVFFASGIEWSSFHSEAAVPISKYGQVRPADCAIAAISCAEAYRLGIVEDNNSAVYWGCWAALDGGRNMPASGNDLKDIATSASSIVSEIEGNINPKPVMMRFEKGNDQHWVVAYDFSGNKNDLKNLIVMNPGQNLYHWEGILSDAKYNGQNLYSKLDFVRACVVEEGYLESVDGNYVTAQPNKIFKKIEFKNVSTDPFISCSFNGGHNCNDLGFYIATTPNMVNAKQIRETDINASQRQVPPDDENDGDNLVFHNYTGMSYTFSKWYKDYQKEQKYYIQFFIEKNGITIKSPVYPLVNGKPEPVISQKIDNSVSESVHQDEPAYTSDEYKIGEIVNFGHRYWDFYVSSEIKGQLEEKERGYYTIGDKVYFAMGPNYTGGQKVYSTIPIRWIVVSQDSDSYYLLSEFVFEGHAFSSDMEAADVNWDTCEIRNYINSQTYLNAYFRPQEQDDILTTNVNWEKGVTKDKLFLPSFEELDAIFAKSASRKAHYYKYDYVIGVPDVTTPITGWSDSLAYDKSNDTCAYWTRSSDWISYGWAQPTYVDCNGDFRCGGRVFYTWSSGLRPMMRVKKNSNYLSKAATTVPSAGTRDISMEYGSYVWDASDAIKQMDVPYRMQITQLGKYDNTWNKTAGGKESLQVGEGRVSTLVGGIASREIEVDIQNITIYPKKPTLTVSADFIGTGSDYSNVILLWAKTADDYIGTGYVEVARSESKNGVYETIFSGLSTKVCKFILPTLSAA